MRHLAKAAGAVLRAAGAVITLATDAVIHDLSKSLDVSAMAAMMTTKMATMTDEDDDEDDDEDELRRAWRRR